VLATGEGMQKLTRTVVPVERVTKSGKRIVMKEKGTGLAGATEENHRRILLNVRQLKVLVGQTTKESKPSIHADCRRW
jgi:hypothetical protein